MTAEYYLFVFDSANSAIAAQKLLSGFKIIVMPTLREITSSCGISLRVDPESFGEAVKIMLASGIEGWRLFHINREDMKNTCVQVYPE